MEVVTDTTVVSLLWDAIDTTVISLTSVYFTLWTRPSCIVHTTVTFRENSFLFFCYAPKRLSPFFYISPQKNPFSTIRYERTIAFLSANG